MKTKIILLIIVFCMAYLLTKAQDITGSGTTNYIPKFTNTTIIGDSKFFDNGTSIGLGTAAPSSYTQFHIDGITQTSGSAANYCTYTRNKGNVANRLVASPKTYSSYLSCWSNNSSSISVYGNLDSLSRLTANSGYTATGAGGFFNINLYDPIDRKSTRLNSSH